jgi:ABC-2 type transport system ATP-binding protein
MEQAEKICDDICILARGRKVLDGELAEVKRAAHGERTVALRFVDAAARRRAAAALAAPADVAAVRDDGADVVVELVAADAAPRLLAALVAAGAGLRRFEIVEPTLHDLFVARVGEGATTAKAGRTEAADG